MVDPLLALCACVEGNSRQQELLATLAPAYQGWQSLPGRAESQGMAPLARVHLDAAGVEVPAECRRALLALGLRHRTANRLRLASLAEILNVLQRDGIDVLVLKGAALASSVYPLPELRPMRDIDILVRPGDSLRVQERLAGLGYAAPAPASIDGRRIHHLPVAQRRVEGLTVSVEVHYRLLPYQDAVAHYDDLAGRSTAIDIDGVAARTLGREDMLWHIYRHAFARPLIEQPIRLIWVADFVAMVEKYLDEIDWQAVRHRQPALINILPLFNYLTPLPDRVVETLDLDEGRPPEGIGQTFQGWPRSSLAMQRSKGFRKIMADTFWPSEWWARLYYGLDGRSLRWWWTRLLGHPLHIGRWLLKYLLDRFGREAAGPGKEFGA